MIPLIGFVQDWQDIVRDLDDLGVRTSLAHGEFRLDGAGVEQVYSSIYQVYEDLKAHIGTVVDAASSLDLAGGLYEVAGVRATTEAMRDHVNSEDASYIVSLRTVQYRLANLLLAMAESAAASRAADEASAAALARTTGTG